MPSLRKRVSSYFRQLSFHNEPRKRHNINENSFVTKYLQGHITVKEGPPIIYGKNPTDLPNYELGVYSNGPNTVVGCYSGPNGGLTTVKRTEKHLSVLDDDIDYIDTPEDETDSEDVASYNSDSHILKVDDSALPQEWNRKSDHVYGLSDSLYDSNQVTKHKNGDPIADCFGIIARNDSAILAVADGVNWGEKASIAAKSAVHGSLHYLNKTIFNDTKPFENLTIKTDESSMSSTVLDEKVNLVGTTREVFVCLLRAFNCAHDLILENKGMLTTLTVAVVLPLKQKMERRVRMPSGEERIETENQYVCCVCNVGDTLAYIYSKKYGVRELTKGSHDINCNRDMRDALGALGPVDGINPELSNLTLSITTLQKGDIVMVASDGLTDNFDPHVCRFTVNTKNEQQPVNKKPSMRQRSTQPQIPIEIKPSPIVKPVRNLEAGIPKPPIKPPRKSKTRDISGRNSAERGSINSNTVSDKSSSPSVENVSIQGKNNPAVVQHSEVNSSNQPEIGDTNKNTSREVKSNDVESSSINDRVDSSSNKEPEYDNPLIAAFMSQNSLDGTPKNEKSSKPPVVVQNRASSLRRQASSHSRPDTAAESSHRPVTSKPSSTPSKSLKPIEEKSGTASGRIEAGYKFLRSKTTIDMRSSNTKPIMRNEDGIPYITPIQRYDLQLLLIEDILKNGLSGKDVPCTSAKQLCENLISYTMSITSAKRHTLEDHELYFDNKNGILVEVSNQEKKIRRKKGLEKVQNLPGKLDHVTVVAYNVGNYFAH